jgi:DNA-directed RNA polymerase subunit RPC12/RpoP
MATCATCGNSYDKAMTVTLHDGSSYQFDSFECAIHMLAPTCSHCGVRIIGHGLEANGVIYCCSHCAKLEGVDQLEDRVDY